MRINTVRGNRLALAMLMSGSRSYWQKVKATGPIAYWPLNEASGLVANDVSGNAFHGAHTNVAVGNSQPPFVCAYYDSALPARTNVYSAALAAAFNSGEVSIMAIVKVPEALWTNGTGHSFIRLRSDGSNLIYLRKHTTNNQIQYGYVAGGTGVYRSFTTTAPTGWFAMVLTVSKVADEFKSYLNGAAAGVTQNGLGAWAGALSENDCALGADGSAGANPLLGYLSHCAVWDRALTPTEVAKLYTDANF
jgi:hypothetical protein